MSVQSADLLFKYRWNLNEYPAAGIEKNNLKVFSTFACGGGSTMGYKLAGYDVIGANDIDPQMAKIYKENHHPKHFFLCPIKDLLEKDLPQELYDLDILDGSPPCSTFSTAGQRDKNWGKEKKFREGQASQVLDDLFFDWIALVGKLKPKVAIAENVKGMIIGNAKGYCKMIQSKLNEIGYDVQLFLLNSATMGLPQQRERVFFICLKRELKFKRVEMNFNYKPIPFSEISDNSDSSSNVTELTKKYWEKVKQGDAVGKFNSIMKVRSSFPLNTIVASNRHFHYKFCRNLNDKEIILGGSFPLNYNFLDVDPNYLIGMSVPPVVMAHVAHNIYLQLFKK